MLGANINQKINVNILQQENDGANSDDEFISPGKIGQSLGPMVDTKNFAQSNKKMCESSLDVVKKAHISGI